MSTNCGNSIAECPLFTKLPMEVRNMIYGYLLVTPEIISHAHELVGGVQTVLAENHHPIPGLDAAILRTCRSIYEEALPILYGRNTFLFQHPDQIRAFQRDGLSERRAHPSIPHSVLHTYLSR